MVIEFITKMRKSIISSSTAICSRERMDINESFVRSFNDSWGIFLIPLNKCWEKSERMIWEGCLGRTNFYHFIFSCTVGQNKSPHLRAYRQMKSSTGAWRHEAASKNSAMFNNSTQLSTSTLSSITKREEKENNAVYTWKPSLAFWTLCNGDSLPGSMDGKLG